MTVREEEYVFVVNVLENDEHGKGAEEFFHEVHIYGFGPVPVLEAVVHLEIRLVVIRYHLQ